MLKIACHHSVVAQVFLPQNNLIGTFSEGMAALSPCLAWIDLSENNLGGTLPPLPQPLRLLNLRGNQLEGSIPAELGQSILLEHFDITGNSLGGVSAQCNNDFKWTVYRT